MRFNGMNNPVLLFDLDDTLLDHSATKAYYLPKLVTTYETLLHNDFEIFKKRWITGIDKYLIYSYNYWDDYSVLQ